MIDGKRIFLQIDRRNLDLDFSTKKCVQTAQFTYFSEKHDHTFSISKYWPIIINRADKYSILGISK